MSEQALAGQHAFALDRNEQSSAHEVAHEAGARFFDEVRSSSSLPFKSDPRIDTFEPKEEYKNGLASEQLMPIEKWAADSLRCGAIDQDQLLTKLDEFSKNADDMWKKMEDSNDMNKFVEMSGDTYTTYSRFGELFNLLDDSHRDKLLETLPWKLRPGE